MVFGNMVFALSMCILNAGSIRRNLSYKQELIKTYLMPFICAGLMGIVVYIVYTFYSKIQQQQGYTYINTYYGWSTCLCNTFDWYKNYIKE